MYFQFLFIFHLCIYIRKFDQLILCFLKGNAIFGIGFVLLSLITNGIIFVSEEKIFSIYHLEPLQVVGLEGMWGVGICLMFIPILNFVKIGVNSQMGILYEGQRYVERVDVYIDQIRNSRKK